MKKLLKEFRDFIMTGNVIDLAVAVLLAAAVGAVVSGFTSDILMPVIGYFSGGADFADLKIVLSQAVVDGSGKITAPENAILYGHWIDTIINLIIVGFILFLIVKGYSAVKNKKKKEVEEAPSAPVGPTQEELLTEIRDELRKRNS